MISGSGVKAALAQVDALAERRVVAEAALNTALDAVAAVFRAHGYTRPRWPIRLDKAHRLTWGVLDPEKGGDPDLIVTQYVARGAALQIVPPLHKVAVQRPKQREYGMFSPWPHQFRPAWRVI